MHPVIRITTCISFIIMAVNATLPVLMVLSICVLGASLIFERSVITSTMRLLLRLKWLLLSIVILYLGWTPGEPLSMHGWQIDSRWWPSEEGVLQALQRIGILILIILSVQLLLVRTSTGELIAAIDWLITPLQWANVERGKFALRCALTIKELQGVEHLVRESMQTTTRGKALERSVDVLAIVYGKSAQGPYEQTPGLEIPKINRPELIQWTLPAAVLLGPIIMNFVLVGL